MDKNCKAIVVCVFDLCHEGKLVCSPGGCYGGTMDSIVRSFHGLYVYWCLGWMRGPGPSSRLESVVWSSVLYEQKKGSSPV